MINFFENHLQPPWLNFNRTVRNWFRHLQDSRVPRVLNNTVVIRPDLGYSIEFGTKISTFSRLRIDIGMSHNGPNTALWTSRDPGVFVIGIEASRFNVARLERYGVWSRNNPTRPIRRFKPANLAVLHVAVDDVDVPRYSEFYNMGGDSGTSSLLKPTKVLRSEFGYELSSIELVPTLSLSAILSKLDWDQFPFIEVCKIDAQGKDLAILKSAGEYLNKIAVLVVEVDTYGQYHGAPGREEFFEYLSASGFAVADSTLEHSAGTDVVFFNRNRATEAARILPTV